MVKYPHLYLSDWPFHTIPDDKHCTFLADRKVLVRDVEVLVRNLSRRDHSTIHLVWAWYGAGKTHTLKFIGHECKKKHSAFLVVYTEFPRGTRSFLDIYRSFVEKIDVSLVTNAYLEVFTSPRKDEAQAQLQADYPDLSNAMKAISMGRDDQIITALYWLRGENVPLKELRDIHVAARIDTPEKSLKVIEWIIKLVNWSKPAEALDCSRVIWIIDEFQRITKCRGPVQEEINSCLQSVFNRCPKSFSLFLSFSGKPGKKMPSWLSRELADRIGLEKVLLLPPLSTDEGVEFIKDVLAHYRASGCGAVPSPTFPFDDRAIEAIINILQKKTEIKPRTIMQACNAVLEDAEYLLESGKLNIIDKDFVTSALQDRVFIDTEDEG